MKQIKESTYKKIYYFLNVPFLLLFTAVLCMLHFGGGYIKQEANVIVMNESVLYASDLQQEIIVNIDKITVILEKFKPKKSGFKELVKEKFGRIFSKKENNTKLKDLVDSSKTWASEKIKQKFSLALLKIEVQYGIKLTQTTYQGVIDELIEMKTQVKNVTVDEESIRLLIDGNNFNFEKNHVMVNSFDKVRGYYDNTLELLMNDLQKIPTLGFVVYLLATLGGYFTKREDDFFYPMLIATVVVFTGTSMYLFNQDWIYNILTNQFVGGFYVFIMSVILLLEIDIIFNNARITEHLIEYLPDMIESIDIEISLPDLPDLPLDF